MQKILSVRNVQVENVGDDSANVSRRKHRVSDMPCSRFQTKIWSYGGLTVVLRWSYGGLMIQVTEKCLELSANKGTKKVRETSDIVGGANGEHEGHEDKNAHEIG